jgi:hypothetical protein
MGKAPNNVNKMVGVSGLEPPASSSRERFNGINIRTPEKSQDLLSCHQNCRWLPPSLKPRTTGERHSPLETQEARFQEYCQRNNLLSIATYIDVESGRRDDRKEYLSLVAYCKEQRPDEVV